MEIDSSRNSEKFSKVGFSKSLFPMIFPGKCSFLRIHFHFQKEFLIIFKSQNRFSNISRLRFSRISISWKFWLSFSKSFPMNFNHFPKKIFKVRVFLTNIFSSMFIFSQELLSIFPGFSSIHDFSKSYKLSWDFKSFSSEFPERLISIFFLRKHFPTPKHFPSIHHVFQLAFYKIT